jgi:hypothetical protein
MRIALIAGGLASIPPDGWGAVENIIWNYKQYLEKLGHTVDIYNTFVYQEIICAIRANYYDFVHTHYDPFCLPLNKHLEQVYCATTHSGHIQSYIKGIDDHCFDISLSSSQLSPMVQKMLSLSPMQYSAQSIGIMIVVRKFGLMLSTVSIIA